MLNKRDMTAIALIFFTALAFRWWYMEWLVVPIPIRGDATHYIQYANNLLDHGIFSRSSSSDPIPDSYFTPGYPSFVAGCVFASKILGITSYAFLLSAQAVIGAFVAVLTFMLARLFLGIGGSSAAAALTTFSPHLVSHGGYILTETLFSFFLALALYLFTSAIIKRRHWRLVVSGALFGFSYLINPVTMFAPVLLVLVVLWVPRSQHIDKRALAACLLVYVGIFGAWHLRNAYALPEKSADSSDRIFWNLIIGMHSDYHSTWRANPRDPNNPADIDRRNFNGSYSLLGKTFWVRLKENPGHYLEWYFVKKPWLLWSWDILVGQGDIYVYPVQSSLYFSSAVAGFTESLMKSIHYWLFGAALLGWLFLPWDNNETSKVALIFLYVVLVYFSAVYVALQSEPRYSVPLRPEMYICAVYFVVQLSSYLITARERSRKEKRA